MNLKAYIYYLRSIWYLLCEFKHPFQIIGIFSNPSRAFEQTIFLKKSGLQFRVRTAMDVWSVKETFIDEFYKIFGTAIENNWTIVDIGAGIGEFCIYAAHGYPNNKIYAFEPFDGSFALLQKNLQLNQIENVYPICNAINDSNEPMTIQRPTSQPLQFVTTASTDNQIDGNTIQSITLEQAWSFYNIDECNLLKLDCEGCEYAVLLNASDGILNSIQRIVMEYHDNVAPFNHSDLVNFLTQKGFTVHLQPNYVHHNLGYLYAHR